MLKKLSCETAPLQNDSACRNSYLVEPQFAMT